VQFSHFSVKEYLTSDRLAISSGDVVRYHITLEPAHTILAQACMSALLWLDDLSSPLTIYAAHYWVAHAEYENVSACLRKAMEYLFDPDKPYFSAWRQLQIIDNYPSLNSTFYRFAVTSRTDVVPLYYAALCGFQDLVEHLVLKHPEQVNASGGGCFVTPLVAALARRHFQTAKFLRDNGANPNVYGYQQATPLHSAAYYGDLQVVHVLLEFKADVNARSFTGDTPLHYLSKEFGTWPPNLSQLHHVSRLLLEHGADVDARSNNRSTPLHVAVEYGRIEVIRVLLEHGASVDAEDEEGRTPFQWASRLASRGGYSDIIELLSEHGAK
jgi:hypothetical protein